MNADPLRPKEVNVDQFDEDSEIDETEEARRPKALRDPGAPTQAEIDNHNLLHLPFRGWCPSCVIGKAKDKPHFADPDKDKAVPVVVFDYGFLGTEGVQSTLPFQVMKHVQTGMICAHAVPRKGLLDLHGSKELTQDIEKLGLKKVILKSDGEAALISIQEDVQRRREDETILENSPVGDSRANGHAERAVQTIAGQVRTLKNALERRCNIKISCDHPLIPWMIEHASALFNKYSVGQDGKTAYERWKGKSWKSEAIEFGEMVHYKFPKKTQMGKLDDRWDEGIYLGHKWRKTKRILQSPVR